MITDVEQGDHGPPVSLSFREPLTAHRRAAAHDDGDGIFDKGKALPSHTFRTFAIRTFLVSSKTVVEGH
jgi:hypothetical protein